jgi:IS66 C-terminal element
MNGTITRKNSLFAGSDAGARRWAIANTLIQTCKLNSIDPLAWFTDVLQRIVSGQTKNQDCTHCSRGTGTTFHSRHRIDRHNHSLLCRFVVASMRRT